MRTIVFLSCILMLQATTCLASNQTAIITTLSKQTGVSEEIARKQLEAVTNAIKAELIDGRDVTIPNFGKFYVSEQGSREGRNPKTGLKIQIPAKRYPRFTSADGFKEQMNPKGEVAPNATLPKVG